MRRPTLRASAPLLIGACALAAALTTTHSAVADEPERIIVFDENAYPPASARPKLVLAGVATTAAFYAPALTASLLAPDAPGASDLQIPVAGPWLALADTGCPEHESSNDCSTFWVVTRAILTTLSGIGQVGGVFIAVEGVLLPSVAPGPSPARGAVSPQSAYRTETSSDIAHDASGDASAAVASRNDQVSLLPLPVVLGEDGLGLGVIGRF